MHNQNYNYSQINRYRYKGFWIQIFLEADFVRECILYSASVELPNKGGVISGNPKESRHEAEFAAEELIDVGIDEAVQGLSRCLLFKSPF